MTVPFATGIILAALLPWWIVFEIKLSKVSKKPILRGLALVGAFCFIGVFGLMGISGNHVLPVQLPKEFAIVWVAGFMSFIASLLNRE